MDALRIKATDDTPEVILDMNTNEFRFEGKSLPESVSAFYEPILAWIDKYQTQALKETQVVFKLEYFNSASSKIISEIIKQFVNIIDFGKKVEIQWQYPEDDEDMHDAGVEYSEIIKFPFVYKSYILD